MKLVCWAMWLQNISFPGRFWTSSPKSSKSNRVIWSRAACAKQRFLLPARKHNSHESDCLQWKRVRSCAHMLPRHKLVCRYFRYTSTERAYVTMCASQCGKASAVQDKWAKEAGGSEGTAGEQGNLWMSLNNEGWQILPHAALNKASSLNLWSWHDTCSWSNTLDCLLYYCVVILPLRNNETMTWNHIEVYTQNHFIPINSNQNTPIVSVKTQLLLCSNNWCAVVFFFFLSIKGGFW